MDSSFDTFVTKVQAKNEKRLSTLEKKAAAAELVHAKVEDDISTMQAEIRRLQAGQRVSDTNELPSKADVATAIAEEKWERPADTTVLCLGLQDRVEKSAVQKGVSAWLHRVVKAVEYDIQGHNLSKSFVIQFKGSAGTAAMRAAKCFDILRGQGGRSSFVELFAESPSGEQKRIYVNEDVSPRKGSELAALRRLKKIINDEIKDFSVFINKETSAITKDWVYFAKVDALEVGKWELTWNAKALRKYEIDPATKESITSQFHAPRPRRRNPGSDGESDPERIS